MFTNTTNKYLSIIIICMLCFFTVSCDGSGGGSSDSEPGANPGSTNPISETPENMVGIVSVSDGYAIDIPETWTQEIVPETQAETFVSLTDYIAYDSKLALIIGTEYSTGNMEVLEDLIPFYQQKLAQVSSKNISLFQLGNESWVEVLSENPDTTSLHTKQALYSKIHNNKIKQFKFLSSHFDFSNEGNAEMVIAKGILQTFRTVTKESHGISSFLVSPNSVTLSVGQTVTPIITILPKRAPQAVFFEISDPTIITQNNHRSLTATVEGETTVTIKSYDDPTYSAPLKIIVTGNDSGLEKSPEDSVATPNTPSPTPPSSDSTVSEEPTPNITPSPKQKDETPKPKSYTTFNGTYYTFSYPSTWSVNPSGTFISVSENIKIYIDITLLEKLVTNRGIQTEANYFAHQQEINKIWNDRLTIKRQKATLNGTNYLFELMPDYVTYINTPVEDLTRQYGHPGIYDRKTYYAYQHKNGFKINMFGFGVSLNPNTMDSVLKADLDKFIASITFQNPGHTIPPEKEVINILTAVPDTSVRRTALKEMNKQADSVIYRVDLDNVETLTFDSHNIFTGKDLSAIPVIFPKLKRLSFLDISVNLSNMSSVVANTLERFSLRDNGLTDADVSKLVTMPNLEGIDIRRNLLTTLPDLQKFPNLKSLIISDAPITGLQTISSTTLETVVARFTNIQKLTFSAVTSKLKTINISSNQIQEITGLKHMPDLEELLIVGKTDTSASYKIDEIISEKLIIFNLIGAGITSIDSISGFDRAPNLHTLVLGFTPISDISKLGEVNRYPALEYLALDNTLITSLAPLATLTSLKDLRIRNTTNLTDISPIATISSLESIIINGSGITDLTAFENRDRNNGILVYVDRNQINQESSVLFSKRRFYKLSFLFSNP